MEIGSTRTIRPAASRFRRRLLAAAAVSGLALTGVAAVGDSGAAAATPRASKITYTAKTVLVPTATIRSQLLGVSPNGATYTFKKRTGKLLSVKVGKVMLLQNLAVRDVTKVAMSKGHFVVTTKPATITDLVSNGTLAWNKGVNFKQGFGIGGAAVPMAVRAGAHAAPSVAARFGMRPMAGSGGITLKGKTSSYDYSVNFKSEGTGLAVKITISKDKPIDLEATITGTLHNLTTAGNISVNKGKLTSAKMLANGLKGSFKLAYSAKPISGLGLGDAGGVKITLPGELVVPFAVGPVPLFLGVKVAFIANVGFSGFDQAIEGSWTLNYDGQGGFSAAKDGATSPAGALKGLGSILLGAANAVRKGPLSMTFGATMPQLELGLGVKGLNVAGNVTLIGQTGVATFGPGCDTRKFEVLGTAGANASFLGFSASLGSAKLFDKSVLASYPRGCGTFPS